MTTKDEDSNKETTTINQTEKEAEATHLSQMDENGLTKVDPNTETKQPDQEYPSAWRLVLITIALCLCVFCVALVRLPQQI